MQKTKKNLPNWKKYCNFIKDNGSAKDLGFTCKDGDLSRFNARYAIAKSFKSIELESFSQETVVGYSGLLKAFLTYSAVELYVNCINHKKNKSIAMKAIRLIDTDKAKEVSEKILVMDKNKRFYNFINKYANKGIKNQIEKFYNKEEHNIIYLLAGIRHIFGHGQLSASSDGIKPKKANEICMILSDFILKQLANNFAKRVDDAS